MLLVAASTSDSLVVLYQTHDGETLMMGCVALTVKRTAEDTGGPEGQQKRLRLEVKSLRWNRQFALFFLLS